MIMHVLVRVHLGDTFLVHACPECARTSPLRPLREPGDGSRCPRTNLPLAGPVVTYETASGRCALCGKSDARVGYLRCCAACSRFYLLDHCEPDWPPPPFYCRRRPCQEAAGR